MNLSNEGNSRGEEASSSNSQRRKKQYNRHSAQQVQQLEDFYKQCPHPNKNQRQQLSRELGLDLKQIKFWFQNKRTQIKAQNERADNDALHAANERIHCENVTLQHSLRSIFCPVCNGQGSGEKERNHNLHILRMENARLKEEHERAISFISNNIGNSTLPPGISLHADMPVHPSSPGDLFGIAPLALNYMPQHPENPTPPHWPCGMLDVNKSIIIETAIGAMNELGELLHVNEPLWIKTPDEGRYVLNRDSYNKLFPKPSHFRSASARFESSKDSGEVAMAAIHLIEMLLDVNKWKDMFPTIVTKAESHELLDTGSLGGMLLLMYQKMHILSPLVAPREFFFIRYCRQLNSSTWVMVDVSYDFIKTLQDTAPARSWKLPSGCMIEDMPNGKSKVTWIEHVQVDDKLLTDRLYRDLVFGSQAYGATRWITTLQMMCERLAFSLGLTTINRHELGGGIDGNHLCSHSVIDSIEGRRNLMKLSHRMVKNFYEKLSIPDKSDFQHLSKFSNSGVRVSLQKSDGPGQPDGFIVSATSSLWLPFPVESLFNFFKDEKKRARWDVLSGGNPVSSVAEISTGADPGNCISIIQPFVPKETNILMLQESSISPLGAQIIYAPINLQSVISVVNGEDTTRVPILPSGFVISDDGRAGDRIRASTGSSSGSSRGSLLTVAFQILVCHSTLRMQLNMESVATVHTLISSTIQRIKDALQYSD